MSTEEQSQAPAEAHGPDRAIKFDDMTPMQRRLHNAACVLDADGDEYGFVGLLREAIKALSAQPQPKHTAPENLPTKEHIRELAQEALDQIMEQAQVFASAWSLVGGRFDSGNALSDAEDAKTELRTMVRSLADLAAETVRPAQAPAPAPEPVARIDSPVRLQRDGLYRAEVTLTRALPQFTDLYSQAQAPAVGAKSAAAEGPTFYLVLSPTREEGVAFTDKGDALYAATGRRSGSGFGVSVIAEEFRDAYADTDSFEIVEVCAASQPPVQGTGGGNV